MLRFFFFSSRRRHTRWNCDWSSDVCSSDLGGQLEPEVALEFNDPGLVGDAQVEGWIATIGCLKDRLGQRRIEEETLALRLGAGKFIVAFELQSFAIIEQALATRGDVFP